MSHRFIQLHFLTSYPAALLNRDDAGFAKRLPFGGAVRTRISSQCLKRHWRAFEGNHSLRGLEQPMSIRSRRTFDEYLVKPLVASGTDVVVAQRVVELILGEVLGKSEKAKKADEAAKAEGKPKKGKPTKAERAGETIQTNQITVLGRPEVEYLLSLAREVLNGDREGADAETRLKKVLKDARKNIQALRLHAGIDAALYGRMVTGDVLSRVDAALHVAHAFTVHGEAAEADYFTAVDDIAQGDEAALGSGLISTTELTSGLYYGYVVVDLPLLVSNLEGCDRKAWRDANRELAGGVVERLVHLVATVSPGAKLGSTAPHSYASMVLVEAGSSQPRTLANAFLRPVVERPDLLPNTYGALGRYTQEVDEMYGLKNERGVALVGGDDELLKRLGVQSRSSLPDLAAWAGKVARGA